MAINLRREIRRRLAEEISELEETISSPMNQYPSLKATAEIKLAHAKAKLAAVNHSDETFEEIKRISIELWWVQNGTTTDPMSHRDPLLREVLLNRGAGAYVVAHRFTG